MSEQGQTTAGVSVLTERDPAYPDALRAIHDPPKALYVRGLPVPMVQPAVAIVGSRGSSRYGLECAERLASELALRGISVVSGLARGIDAAAHRGALKGGGRTIAVLGSGLSEIYPPEHRALAEDIAASGWLVSEYPMATLPMPYNFPRRNRIISGLSLGVVVVEAASRSGALITADFALEQGRDVFAVPGPVTAVTSQGTHSLLKQGARLVTSVDDILDELRLVPVRVPLGEPSVGLDARLLGLLEGGPLTIDLLAVESGAAMRVIASALVGLELKGVVRQLPGKRFMRTVGG
jgi:DNA processing protein